MPLGYAHGRCSAPADVVTKGGLFIARRPLDAAPSREGPRVNDKIDTSQVRLVDENGQNHGVVDTRFAIRYAEDRGLDLVEVAGNADPPVCKVMDFGKFKYEAQKKANEARKKQKIIEVKEIKIRPNIDQHDYDVKMRSMTKFLTEGDKVKVTLRFRGREMAHQDLGLKVLERVREDLQELSKVEQFPKMEGRQMTMVISPK
jgi:translation initiation factor IF-3